MDATAQASNELAGSGNSFRALGIFVGLVVVAIAGIFLWTGKSQTRRADPEPGLLVSEKMSAPGQPLPKPVAGKIVVTSDPAGATILVGSQEKGIAPLEIADLPFGKHLIEARLKGHGTLKRELEITPDQLNLNMAIKLEPIVPAMGILIVQSRPPGAQIMIGKKLAGLTPRTFSKTVTGEYKVFLKKDGYQILAT